MTELLTRPAPDALAVRSESERLIDLRIMPWGVVAETPEGRESFARGAFAGVDPTRVTVQSGVVSLGGHLAMPIVGRGIPGGLEERADGAYLTVRIAGTPAGDELLTLASEGVLADASVSFQPRRQRRGHHGEIERTEVDLRRVAILERGAYPGAAVLAVRSEEVPTMIEATELVTETPVPYDDTKILARVDRVEDLSRSAFEELAARIAAVDPVGARPVSPLARFATAGEFFDAAYAETDLVRVLADQLTTDNPGVIPPAWVSKIAGILGFARPAVTALGGPAPLGSTGMELDWPYLDPALSLDTIVAKQAAEKTQIASVKVKILKASQPIDTYAGGSDVSYQLIRRASPSYREAYLRILEIAYARTTEAAFEAQLLAVAGSSLVLTATSTADQVRAFLFAASAIVADNTGMPATVDLVSPTEFARLGGLPNLWPSAYGTANIAGTAQASTLAVNVSGLPIIRAPFLPGNTHLVTNSEGAAWHEDGPFPISAEDVAKLGQNIAIWGMGTGATTAPKAIVKSTLT
jgi:HK97 family phage prohead protease